MIAWLSAAWLKVRAALAVAVFGLAIGVVAVLLWMLHGSRKRANTWREQRDVARAKAKAAELAARVRTEAHQASAQVAQEAAAAPPPDVKRRDDLETTE